MSEALEALKTLRENVRSDDGQIWRQGIRDNDRTRKALTVLMDFASAALEQGEAVARVTLDATGDDTVVQSVAFTKHGIDLPEGTLLYTAPPSTAEAINLLAAGFTAQLIGFAANWERVKELEDALAALLPFTDDLHDEGPECEGWQSCDLAEARSKASKLLEKGNE